MRRAGRRRLCRLPVPTAGIGRCPAKISYAVYEPEWGWLLFTGLYVDDVDAAFRATLWRQGGVTLGLLAVVLLAALRFPHAHHPSAGRVQWCERAAWRKAICPVSCRVITGRDRPAVRPMALMQERLDVAQHRAFHGFDRRGLAPNRRRQHGPARPHREAAAALEQTAASVEQITATAKQSADHVREVSAPGQSALARQGSEETQHAIDAMREISQSSQRIDEIIRLIDEIAFQTNILALNAAVGRRARASRAGASPWWRAKCGRWRSARPPRPRKSRA